MVVTRTGKVFKAKEVVLKSPKAKVVKKVPEVKVVPAVAPPAKTKQKKDKPKPEIPRGKPKSGRVWKNERKKFSTIIKSKGIRNNFQKKEALRKELVRVKEISKAARNAKVEEKEQKKERRRENMKRQEANRQKSEIVQVITNTSKLKKMKRKHLRQIEKRDTTKVG